MYIVTVCTIPSSNNETEAGCRLVIPRVFPAEENRPCRVRQSADGREDSRNWDEVEEKGSSVPSFLAR
jgi:hypothetical protein